MTMLEVTFGRDGAPLVVTSVPPVGDGFWLPEDGLGQIAQDLRKTYAPESAYVRSPLLAAVQVAGTVPLTIYAKASTSAGLQALREELDTAASQWLYDLTVSVDGVASAYNAEISLPAWAPFDSGMVRAHIDRCQLVIPVNP